MKEVKHLDETGYEGENVLLLGAPVPEKILPK